MFLKAHVAIINILSWNQITDEKNGRVKKHRFWPLGIQWSSCFFAICQRCSVKNLASSHISWDSQRCRNGCKGISHIPTIKCEEKRQNAYVLAYLRFADNGPHKRNGDESEKRHFGFSDFNACFWQPWGKLSCTKNMDSGRLGTGRRSFK